MASTGSSSMKIPDLPAGLGNYRFLFLSELLKKPVFAGKKLPAYIPEGNRKKA